VERVNSAFGCLMFTRLPHLPASAGVREPLVTSPDRLLLPLPGDE